MRRTPVQRVLLCDDDPSLRMVLGRLLADLGYRVVGEADTVDRARAVLESDLVDLVVVDLALAAGRGEQLLGRMAQEFDGVDAVVFSAFVEDAEELSALGAVAVFDKPDLAPLLDWCRERLSSPPTRTHDERRRPPHPAPGLPDRGPVSPSGLEPWPVIASCVERLWPGDAVVAFGLVDAPGAETADAAFHLDGRLALARGVAGGLRPLDRLGMTPGGVPVCLLVAGHPEAPSAVFGRLQVAWDRLGLDGVPVAAFAHVRRDEAPVATLDRVLDRVADGATTADHPLRLA